MFDEIIDRLSPSTIRLILDFNNDGMNHIETFNKSFKDIERMKVYRISREMKRKVFDLKSKVAENRKYLVKLSNELGTLKSLKICEGNDQGVRAYALKICELESKMKNLTENEGNIELCQLFTESEGLNNEIRDYEAKILVEESKYKCYEGFPPDIEQGKDAVVRLKERIRDHETVVELLF